MSAIETVIPYFGGDPFRSQNLQIVLDHLSAGGDDDIFGHVSCYPLWIEGGESQAHARNAGVNNCVGVGIYFNDADSVVSFAQIIEAVRLAVIKPGLVFAYTDYIRLNSAGEPCEHIPGSGSSGAVAISRACFEEVGGYDERFTGWGYEDLDFARRCAERWPIRRVPGELRHLWHPPAGGRSEAERDLPVTDEQKANLELYESLCVGVVAGGPYG